MTSPSRWQRKPVHSRIGAIRELTIARFFRLEASTAHTSGLGGLVGTAFLALFVLGVSLLTALPALPQTSDTLAAEALTAELDAIEQEAGGAEGSPEVLETVAAARTALTDAVRYKKDAEAFQHQVDTAEEILAELDASSSDFSAWIDKRQANLAGATTRAGLIELESLRAASELNRSDYQSQLTAMTERPRQIADRLINLRAEGNRVSVPQLASTPEAALPGRAQLALASVRRVRRDAQIAFLQTELDTLPVRESLLSRQFEVETERVRLLDRLLITAREIARRSDVTEAEQLVARAQALQADSDRSKQTVQLAYQVRDLVNQRYAAEARSLDYRNLSAELDSDRAMVERIVGAGTANDTLGDILSRIRDGMPAIPSLKSELSQLDKMRLILAQDAIVWEDELAEGAFGDSDEEALYRAALGAAIAALGTLDDALLAQRSAIADVLNKTTELKAVLDRRLLWLPTNEVFSPSWISSGMRGVSDLFAADKWRAVLREFSRHVSRQPLITLLLLGAVLALWLARPRLRQHLKALSRRVRSTSADSILVTPRAVLATLLIAMPFPLLLTGPGLVLSGADDPFSRAVGSALLATSILFFWLFLFRQMCSEYGVFSSHFRWSNASLRALKFHLGWFLLVSTPTTFALALSFAAGVPEAKYGLGMVAFMIGSIAIAIFTFLMLNPKSGAAVPEADDGKAHAWRLLATIVLVGAPPLVGLLPLAGYLDSAVQIQSRVFMTGILLLLTAVAYGLLKRTYEVLFRRLARQHALERMKARRAAAEEEQVEAIDAPPVIEERELDLAEVSQQTRRIFFYLVLSVFLLGLWSVWSPVISALGIADTIVLWQGVQHVDGAEVRSPVTLAHLVGSILTIAITFVAAGNLRGMLEVTLFNKLVTSPGTRYATSTLIGYVIVAAGLLAGLSQLGLDWSKLQWVMAALGVGLGFGLQEIVANFICGVIILFEQPVRVGDTVTIGDVSGTVTDISIRATTVTDWESREVLLPNKAIITENVINWTRSDQVTRLLLTIGVAYGSDIERVRSLITDVLTNHPYVLSEPAHSVLFMNHGDSSLDFEIRAFVASPSHRLITTHELNTQINATLAAAGIEIPYPQRDVHVREIVRRSVNDEVAERLSQT